jgi:site-specific DNA-methyltransferase (adenine-specific)
MSAPASRKVRLNKEYAELSPIEQVMNSSALAQLEKAQSLFEAEIVGAFREVRDGFSADRVVADPDLNHAFVRACRQTGIAGDVRSWNYALLRLRKAGRLAEFRTERRTEYSWQECDPFLFASEIAWKQLLDCGFASLDDILCDPVAAARFDSIAMSLAPGFSLLMYRWGALKLRKASKRARSQSIVLARGRLSPLQEITARALAQVPDEAGVYLVHNRDQKHPLYAGGSLNLRTRLNRQFDPERTRTWKKNWGQRLAISFFVSEAEAPLVLAYQSLYVQLHHPQLNIPELALA